MGRLSFFPLKFGMFQDGSFDLAGFKIVYVAPMKALVQEVVQSFTQRLEKAYGAARLREMDEETM